MANLYPIIPSSRYAEPGSLTHEWARPDEAMETAPLPDLTSEAAFTDHCITNLNLNINTA